MFFYFVFFFLPPLSPIILVFSLTSSNLCNFRSKSYHCFFYRSEGSLFLSAGIPRGGGATDTRGVLCSSLSAERGVWPAKGLQPWIGGSHYSQIDSSINSSPAFFNFNSSVLQLLSEVTYKHFLPQIRRISKTFWEISTYIYNFFPR